VDAAGRDADNRRMFVSTRTIWTAYGAVTAAIVVTYARVDPAQLYHVSGDGLPGGVSRAVVYANFPLALVSAPLAVWAAARIATRAAAALAAVAVALCAVVVVPGVVDQADLDVRVVNLVPLAGVLIALGLELAAPRQRLWVGRGRLVAIGCLGLLSLVWLAAELGFHVGFGVFLAGEQWDGHAAVHLGHHHGLDGTMLAATGLVLLGLPSRAGRAYAALMTAYGLVNGLQDAWTEQVVKRDWTPHEIPNALHPAANWSWLAILVLAAAVFAVVETRRGTPDAPPADIGASRYGKTARKRAFLIARR
jgi:hypothetical protein